MVSLHDDMVSFLASFYDDLVSLHGAMVILCDAMAP
jgi:hypothetical protein